MTRVKICGLTNIDDAMLAVEYGADELGFNFYKGSKRYLSPQNTREIIDQLPISSGNVGVFVDEPIDSLLEIAEFVGLNGIQLHGDEDEVYIKTLRNRTKRFIVKAFRVVPNFLVGGVLDWPLDFPLFDTHSSHQYGGTGATFDWEEFGTDIYLWFPLTAYLAGGLNPDNVADAIRIVKPYAVDVASGVESQPGKKDPNKMKSFIENAKKA
ncbi:MAG: N-(5'-phosphoribosyl)anthranilate isomerase [Acidobacteria bacterium]|nr:MAG: N-(5'-phosphoribosyl)anthranilate isomerase [Acidobacteriota bacterium]